MTTITPPKALSAYELMADDELVLDVLQDETAGERERELAERLARLITTVSQYVTPAMVVAQALGG